MNKQEAKQYTDLKIDELRSLFEQKYDVNIFPPVPEDVIINLEMTYNIFFKDDYKEWLNFSSKMAAVNNEVRMYLPDITINKVFSLPVGYFVVGEIKPLDIVFAINKKGMYSYFVQGKNTPLEAFGDILDMICRYIRKEPLQINIPEENKAPEKAETPVVSKAEKKENLLSYFFVPKTIGVYTEQIKHIKNNCNILQNESATFFGEPLELNEIEGIESRIGIRFPMAYKLWLQNCGNADIYGGTLRTFRPDEKGVYKKFVPDELITIGTLIGDGEYLCLSKKNGKFVRYRNGKIQELYDFGCVLTWIDAFLKDHMPYSSDVRPKYIAQDNQIPGMSPREIYVYLTRIKPDKYVDAAFFWKNRISKYSPKRDQFVNYLKNTSVDKPEDSISANLFDEIMLMLRSEAVREYWNNERDLVKSGRGTENWNPNQQLSIMNILSMEEKLIRLNGGIPSVFDEKNNTVKNGSGMDLKYEVRAVKNIDDHPEFAANVDNLKGYYILPCTEG